MISARVIREHSARREAPSTAGHWPHARQHAHITCTQQARERVTAPNGGHGALDRVACDGCSALQQTRREELAVTVLSLERMVKQMTAEQEQLLAERDTLDACVRSLLELQEQPPQPNDVQTHVSWVSEHH